MKYEESEPTLFESIELPKEGLVSYATGNTAGIDNEEYRRLRKILLST
ncbi:hypothetical protein [Paenibacillus peoriae]|nr:hypothetical protein [Paenibacillus peoriae]